jgi:predicted lysophospholipase L1 biosynthesis ABC-type transport system permease subunit
VVVNEACARFYFAGKDPIGQSFTIDSATVQIAGVVADVRDETLTEGVRRRFYLPWVRNTVEQPGNVAMIVRTAGDPARAIPQLRRAVESVDPLLAITDADPLTSLMNRSVSEQRLLMQLGTGFGLFSLLLASLGLYGVMSYAVTRRTGEMGLRSALGSRPGAVAGLVLRDAMRLVGAGLLMGLPLGLAAVRVLESQLVGVTPGDVASVVATIAVLTLSAVLAALLPALRAARVSPLVALQQE